jgi:hypothetical protein
MADVIPFQLPPRPDWLDRIQNVKTPQQLAGTDMIVEGLWAKGEVLLLGGHAKSWKSWAQMDLNYCIANGLGWLAWPSVQPGKVLHIDLELRSDDIDRRFAAIAESYGQGSLANIEVLPLRGVHFTLNDFSQLAQHLEKGIYLAISFDPTYRMLAGSGLNESDPGVITDLMNRALSIATDLGSGINLLQHFSKGNQSEKRAIDAFSGSGVWGRAPDGCVTFREHADERCYTVSTDLRHWPHQDPFVVEFNYPRFCIHAEKDPENLRVHKLGRKPSSFDVNALCNLIESDEYISYSSLLRRSSASGISKRTFLRRLKDAKGTGFIALQPTNGTYFLTSPYLAKFRNHDHTNNTENNSHQA